MADISTLLFGSTGSGKTTLIGELAEYCYKTLGKRTRLYTADPGGFGSIQAHVNVGLIKVVPLMGRNPWAYEWATDGLLPPESGFGKWVADPKLDEDTGLWAYEGIHSFGTAMMQDLARKAAGGQNVGGGLAIKVDGGDGITVGSNNQAHYGIVQTRITDLVWRSFNRPGHVLWTSLDRKGMDPETGASIVGPEAPGKALVSSIPGWFTYTFHLTTKPAQLNQKPVHELHLVHHQDMSTGGMQAALSNARFPLNSFNSKDVKLVISPASLVKAFESMQNVVKTDEDRLKKELGL